MEGSMTVYGSKLSALSGGFDYPFETTAVDSGVVIEMEGLIEFLRFNNLGQTFSRTTLSLATNTRVRFEKDILLTWH
jgi:hypothetical protein